jgi:pectate lyase
VQVTSRIDVSTSVWQNWRWRSINDTFVNGAYFVQSGSDSQDDAATLQGNGKFAAYMTESAGALSCSTTSAC